MDDVRSGRGKYTYPNGDTYDGDWVNNKKHGVGTYLYSTSQVKYQGTWEEGKMDGTGEQVFANYKYKGHFIKDQV